MAPVAAIPAASADMGAGTGAGSGHSCYHHMPSFMVLTGWAAGGTRMTEGCRAYMGGAYAYVGAGADVDAGTGAGSGLWT